MRLWSPAWSKTQHWPFFSIKLFSRAILGYEYFLFFIFFSEQVLISLMLSYADSHVSLFMWSFALSAFTQVHGIDSVLGYVLSVLWCHHRRCRRLSESLKSCSWNTFCPAHLLSQLICYLYYKLILLHHLMTHDGYDIIAN